VVWCSFQQIPKSENAVYVYILWMNPTCRQSRQISSFHPSYSSILISWKNLLTGLQVQRSYVCDCCHGPEEEYTEWCNISYHPPLPSASPSLIIIFLFFSLHGAISLDWIAPWPQAPVAMWRCILSPQPPLHLPLPLYRFLCGVEVVWLMSSNPISQCSRPSPAGGFSHAVQPDQSGWPPLCILIIVAETENTFTNYRTTPASSFALSVKLSFIIRIVKIKL